MGRTTAKTSLLDFETLASRSHWPVAARNDVTARLLADCFKTFSALPENWTVSGPCHLELRRVAFGTENETRLETFETETRRSGLETRLKTETKSRDSVTAGGESGDVGFKQCKT